jgi:hypothetical protein
MAVIRLGGFQGEIPRIHPRLLPEGNAQTALNCRIDSGALESIKDTSNIQSATDTDTISLHRFSASIWLESDEDVDWLTYPVANDIYGRVIFADPTASELRVTDASLVGAGGYPTNWYRLDVPPPTAGFSVTLQGTADDTDEVPETRYYVATFVNSWGAEGPPSPVSNQIEWRTGQNVLIEGLPTLSGTYNITHRRIYRINTGASGATNFQYVTEVAIAQANYVVTAITRANPVVVTTQFAHGLTTGQEVLMSGLGTETAQVITAMTKADPCRVTVVAHGFVTDDWVDLQDLGGANGMDELDDKRRQIVVIDADRFDLYTENPTAGVDSSGFVTWVSGGTAAKALGMDELDGNSYITTVITDETFSLLSVDGAAYKKYRAEGSIRQVAGTTYTDYIPSAALAEVIPSEIYDPPNDATIGLVSHPAGFLAGFFGNTLCFSEPGAPHAWPIDYRLVTNSDIIGLGVFGNTIAVVTKGWPYLAVGSDPSAIAFIELEVEQACVAKRSIVDFGTAIAYASPDGLIVLSNGGATNASAGLFTRDQWQALVPNTFEAYNWEQKYLCFYDDGAGVSRGFIIDPLDPRAGVRYVAKDVTGAFKDIEEDLLYCIVSDEIETWDQGSTLQYTWKSKPVHTPHAVNMSACKITADAYPVDATFYVDDVKRHTRLVTSNDAFRLPGGFKGEKFEITLKGKKKVSQVTMATTMRELAVTV